MRTFTADYHTVVPVKLRGRSIERQVDHMSVKQVFITRTISESGMELCRTEESALVSPPLPEMDARVLSVMFNTKSGPSGAIAEMVTRRIELLSEDARSDDGFPVTY